MQFMGKPVCVGALRALLGVGTSTIQRVRQGEQAYSNHRRPEKPKHPTFGFVLDSAADSKWVGVVQFLWNLYQSSAEVMPTDCRKPYSSEMGAVEDRDPDYELRQVNHLLQTLRTYSSDLDVHMIGPGTFAGQCRYLQSSSRTELFWEYVAACRARGEEAGSFSTFLRVANCILKPGIRNGHLKFRGVNQHGQCDICFEKKKQIRTAKTPFIREEAQRALSHHHLSQWLDRQQYWSTRTMSQNYFKTMLEMGSRFLG